MSVKEKIVIDHMDKAIKLAGSMVIKNVDSITLMNQDMESKYGATLAYGSGESDWRYYKHLFGEYHTQDISLTINALEDQSVIPFTKASLATRPVTLEAYRYGKEHYLRLVDRYPEYELYIKGVLYPVPYSESIPAQDGEILAWEKTYLDMTKEWYIMDELQEWIYNWLSRWDNKGFGLTDDLYPAAKHAILSLYLPAKILELKLKHSESITSSEFYRDLSIATWYGISEIPEYIPEYVRKWLYRNVRVNKSTIGQNRLLSNIQNNVAHISMISMDSGNRYQNYLNILRRPEILLKTIDSLSINSKDPNKRYILQEIYDMEKDIAFFNNTYQDFFKRPRLDNTRFSTTATGILISDLSDRTNSVSHNKRSMILDILGYAVQNEYSGLHTYTNPETGIEYTIITRDLFYIYLWYITKLQGGDPLNIPTWVYTHVPVSTNSASVLSNKPQDVKIDDAINEYDQKHKTVNSVSNGDTYNDMVDDIYKANLSYWLSVSNNGSKTLNGVLRNFWFKFYSYGSISSSGYSTYVNMVSSTGISFPTNIEESVMLKTIDAIEKSLFSGVDALTIYRIREFLKGVVSGKISYTTHLVGESDTQSRIYGRLSLPRMDFGTISEHYAVHGVINEPPHASIMANGDWFKVSFDQLTTSEQAQIKDIYSKLN